jgi:hypothetical protein
MRSLLHTYMPPRSLLASVPLPTTCRPHVFEPPSPPFADCPSPAALGLLLLPPHILVASGASPLQPSAPNHLPLAVLCATPFYTCAAPVPPSLPHPSACSPPMRSLLHTYMPPRSLLASVPLPTTCRPHVFEPPLPPFADCPSPAALGRFHFSNLTRRLPWDMFISKLLFFEVSVSLVKSLPVVACS